MMKKQRFTDYLQRREFCDLFLELGWNNPEDDPNLYEAEIDNTLYAFHKEAQLSGFMVLSCQVDAMPAASVYKKLDTKLRPSAHDYICIYYQPASFHQMWIVPVNKVDKRDLVVVEYTTADQAEFLFDKVDGFSFLIGEVPTIVDVKAKVHATFTVNSENVTKSFYKEFRQQQKAFMAGITGIDDYLPDNANANKSWYSSIMLDRLMFCYFIQKKRFLDGDTDYLQHKLAWVKQNEGDDEFYSFYRCFLLQLFYDGLNSPRHDEAFCRRFGRIPYLNGGLFDLHILERQYTDIQIHDDSFERLFAFFDKWEWHLDTRLTASGRDINPDVLGYIFEQFINDRAQMGAYYTKEDITEYIGRNCILPFLFDKVEHSSRESAALFAPDGMVWKALQQSGGRYIFDAVKQGYTPDWRERIPADIACGLDTAKPDLLERRKLWNTKTPEPWALPTEIWRETIERLERCDMLLAKIRGGEITQINDFITYNLDIRSFAYDLLANTDDHRFIAHFYRALQTITILDPTCGSGAFLFAAMNILEPLYEVCIDRMQELNAANPRLFSSELAEINGRYRSNIQYFIYKSIILRNLYGVDIMAEAVEIAKLRLFLKMVAVVDADPRQENLGLDPLPDIDFNIRCGNTLVGYANEDEITASMTEGDIFKIAEFREKVETEMQKVSAAYDHFRTQQLDDHDDLERVKQSKMELKQRLAKLTALLDHQMSPSSEEGIFDTWKDTAHPFHWIAEYYSIIHGNGGFDVIIGNPPYVEYKKKDKATGKAISDLYKLDGYKTLECGNLYAYVLERCKSLISKASYIGMIVPLSGHSTERMSPLVTNFYKKFGLRLQLNLSADANPQKLFEGVKFRLTIFFASNAHKGCFSTKYTRWLAEERKCLFKSLVKFNEEQDYRYGYIIGKISSPIWISIYRKITNDAPFFFNKGLYKCLYHNAPVNWIRSHSFTPYFTSEKKGDGITTQLKSIQFENKEKVKTACNILNSSLFFIWWITNSDCYHLNSSEIVNFRYTYNRSEEFLQISDKLSKDMLAHSRRRVYYYKATGRVEYDEFYMKKSKPIIDEIDKVLAKHYGFTDEELDFIINYDIKYRMGDELNEEE